MNGSSTSMRFFLSLCYVIDAIFPAEEETGNESFPSVSRHAGVRRLLGAFFDMETLDLLHVLFSLRTIWKTLSENLRGYIAGKKCSEEDESP